MRPGSASLVLLIEGLLLLAVFVLVPLGLALAGPAWGGRPRWRLVVLQGAGLALGAALLWRGGPAAALLCAPWLMVTAVVALRRLRHMATRGRHPLEALAHDFALLCLPVGALWALVYAGGLILVGFTGTQALLTAIHFHYAGFGACVITGQLGRTLPLASRRRLLHCAAAPLMLAGIPLLAGGIALSRALEKVAGVDVALALALLGVLLLCRLGDPIGPVARILSGLAGLAALVASALAMSFIAVGFAQMDGRIMERMVLWHGLVNALGFVGLGLLSFALDSGVTRRRAGGRGAAPGSVGCPG